jgi:hypothetical protein
MSASLIGASGLVPATPVAPALTAAALALAVACLVIEPSTTRGATEIKS